MVFHIIVLCSVFCIVVLCAVVLYFVCTVVLNCVLYCCVVLCIYSFCSTMLLPSTGCLLKQLIRCTYLLVPSSTIQQQVAVFLVSQQVTVSIGPSSCCVSSVVAICYV
jgi:hypothetical protein